MIIVFELTTGDYDMIENHLYFIEYESIEKYRQDLLRVIDSFKKFEHSDKHRVQVCLSEAEPGNYYISVDNFFYKNAIKWENRVAIEWETTEAFTLTPLDKWLKTQIERNKDLGTPFLYDFKRQLKLD